MIRLLYFISFDYVNTLRLCLDVILAYSSSRKGNDHVENGLN